MSNSGIDPNDLPPVPVNPEKLCKTCGAVTENSCILRNIPNTNDSEVLCANCKSRLAVLKDVPLEKFILFASADQVKLAYRERNAAIKSEVTLTKDGKVAEVKRTEIKRGGYDKEEIGAEEDNTQGQEQPQNEPTTTTEK